MKFPLFNLDIFKRSSSPSTNRITTTFDKRKSHRTKSSGSSHRKTPRKRSITYYSPSKSRLYPTEYFPTLQRLSSTVSTDALGHNRTYLCSDQDVIVHHDFEWLPHQQQQLPQAKQIDPRLYATADLYESNDTNNNTMFVRNSAINRDYNASGIVVGDGDSAAANQFDRCTKECVGVPSPAFIMPNSRTNGNSYLNLKCESSQQQPSFRRTDIGHQSHQQHLTGSHLSTHGSSGAITTANNINSLFDGTTPYVNSPNVALFHHSTMPIMKKHKRPRRKKVRFVCIYGFVLLQIWPRWATLQIPVEQQSSNSPLDSKRSTQRRQKK